jgi:glutamate carboxypeptidase
MQASTDPWPRNPKTESLFQIWKAAGEEVGLKVVPEERGGLSDGNLIWRNVSVLDGLGPAGNNAHCSERSDDGSKDQEYILIPSFVPKAVLNVQAILKLLKASPPN